MMFQWFRGKSSGNFRICQNTISKGLLMGNKLEENQSLYSNHFFQLKVKTTLRKSYNISHKKSHRTFDQFFNMNCEFKRVRIIF